MAILKNFTILLCILTLSCGKTASTTVVIKLKTDTYISNQDSSNHSGGTSLKVSNSGGVEERVVLKLPTGNNDDNYNLDQCLNNLFCTVFFMPLVLLVKILTTCSDATLQPANLTSAVLALDTVDGSSPGSGTIVPELLSRGWYQTVNWTKAHPFSSSGNWLTPGGDLDFSRTFNPNCTSLSSGTCAAGEVKFEMTDYFKSLITTPNSNHFGFILRGVSTLNRVELHSVQTATSSKAPRIIATYTGACSDGSISQPKTTWLSEP